MKRTLLLVAALFAALLALTSAAFDESTADSFNPTRRVPQRCGGDQDTPIDPEVLEELNRVKRDVVEPYTFETRDTTNWNKHHNNQEMADMLDQFVAAFQQHGIIHKYSIGKSGLGTDLTVVEITTNAGTPNPRKLQFRYSANMHGDEVVGREMSLRFIEYLCAEYVNGNTEIVKLLQSTSIHILSSMNPDGYQFRARSNHNGYDLNRNFPDQFEGRRKREEENLGMPARLGGDYSLRSGTLQPETRAVKDWANQNYFVLCANFHGGSVVANYPFDGNRQHRSGQYSASPDDNLFKSLALTYSLQNQAMRASHEFRNGITNGAQWYILYGGMQDWHYLHRGCFELTIELSDIKWPSANSLNTFWQQNSQSMLKYIQEAHKGISGTIIDATTRQPIQNARISINDPVPTVVVYSNTHGDYYRPLLEGTYTVHVKKEGYADASQTITVVKSALEMSKNLFNFELTPQ